MSSPTPGPLFIIGVGPLIGSHIPRLFASHGFTQIALFSRTSVSLSDARTFILSSSPNTTIHTYEADVTDTSHFTAVLAQAIQQTGAPEVVVYNAARIKFGTFDQYSEEDIVTDFKIPCVGLYTSAKILLPYLRKVGEEKEGSHPSLFVTSSPLIDEPYAPVFSLSMAKTAQACLVKTLVEQERGKVHVALVVVEAGIVTLEHETNNPERIAGLFWGLWGNEKGKWASEVRL